MISMNSNIVFGIVKTKKSVQEEALVCLNVLSYKYMISRLQLEKEL